MGFAEHSIFQPKSEHSSTPERGLDQLSKDLDEAQERAKTACSYANGIREQLALWGTTLQETDASLSSPDAKQLIDHTQRLHNLYRDAIREFSAAMKDLEALEEAHEAVSDTNVFGSSSIGEA